MHAPIGNPAKLSGSILPIELGSLSLSLSVPPSLPPSLSLFWHAGQATQSELRPSIVLAASNCYSTTLLDLDPESRTSALATVSLSGRAKAAAGGRARGAGTAAVTRSVGGACRLMLSAFLVRLTRQRSWMHPCADGSLGKRGIARNVVKARGQRQGF
ncbi:hypothetical protein L1887_53345 [Cichorium endivia]|nr:hypothetical protein L1887_53345 [Cichorium endivia]